MNTDIHRSNSHLFCANLCLSVAVSAVGCFLNARPRVIAQRSLITQNTTRTNMRRTSDVAAATDKGALHFRRSADARVAPQHGILDLRALFDVAAGPKNRVNDLNSWFNSAVVGDDR